MPLFFAFALLLAAPAAAFELQLSSTEPAPGEVLRVLVSDADDPGRFRLRLGERDFPLYSISTGTLRGLVGFPATAEPGKRLLTVERRRLFRSPLVQNVELELRSKAFAQQNIRMPEEKVQLTESPDAKANLEAIRAQLRCQSPEQLWEGPFSLPAEGRLSSAYGLSRTLNNSKPWSWHRGVDIAAPAGTRITAPNRGRVALAGNFAVQGGTIVLDHGQGVVSIFMHLGELEAASGQDVAKSSPIAAVGSEGFSTGAHLHWGLYVHGDPVDPLPWLKQEF